MSQYCDNLALAALRVRGSGSVARTRLQIPQLRTYLRPTWVLTMSVAELQACCPPYNAKMGKNGLINEEEFYREMKKRGTNPLDDLDSDSD